MARVKSLHAGPVQPLTLTVVDWLGVRERPKPATNERIKISHYQGVICPVVCSAFELETHNGESTERGRDAFHFDAVFPRLFMPTDRP